MKIERIKIDNFRTLTETELKDIPQLAVFIGENGSGKSTLFSVFGFLKDALKNNVGSAVANMGGFKELKNRNRPNDPITN